MCVCGRAGGCGCGMCCCNSDFETQRIGCEQLRSEASGHKRSVVKLPLTHRRDNRPQRSGRHCDTAPSHHGRTFLAEISEVEVGQLRVPLPVEVEIEPVRLLDLEEQAVERLVLLLRDVEDEPTGVGMVSVSMHAGEILGGGVWLRFVGEGGGWIFTR